MFIFAHDIRHPMVYIFWGSQTANRHDRIVCYYGPCLQELERNTMVTGTQAPSIDVKVLLLYDYFLHIYAFPKLLVLLCFSHKAPL